METQMFDRLKTLVEERFGEKIVNVKNCQRLSESMRDYCGETLSEATIRRLWKMLPGPAKPSLQSLNVLSRFAGYQSWDDFVKKYVQVEELPNQISIWNEGKIYAEKYSLTTVNYIFKKAGVIPSYVVQRQCVDDYIETLIDSHFAATGIIAPGGYGKSLGIASWVFRNLTKKRYTNTIIFFISGSQVDSTYSANVSLASWLSTLLFHSSTDLFGDAELFKGRRLILIVDALDEIDGTLSKSALFFRKLVDFVSLYDNVKIIVSSRSSIWGRELVYEVTSNAAAAAKWLGAEHGIISNDYTNLPPLNIREIQDIIDIFVNSKTRASKLMVDQLNFLLKETISHPYMLKLFVSIYRPQMLKFQNTNDLIDEFIDREIVNSKYADEKLDIINYILEKQEYGRILQPVKKNNLKDKYPISLRRGGNYYSAYEHMLSFGILSEETIENQYKNKVSVVDFSHSNLRELLITRYLIERNEGISHALFEKVDKEFSNSDLKIRLISNLFSIAYSENNLEALKDFFLLPSSISEEKEIFQHIIYQFRADKPIQDLLVKSYSKNKRATNYLIDNFFDFDAINNSFSRILEIILENSTEKNEKIYSLAGLAYSSAQLLDYEEFMRLSNILLAMELDDTCGSYCIAIFAIWKVYYAYISRDKMAIKSLPAEIEEIKELFIRRFDNSTDAEFSFYLEIMPHILLFDDIDYFGELLDTLNEHRNDGYRVADLKVLATLDLFLSIYRTKKEESGADLTSIQAYTIERHINSLSMTQNYMNRTAAYVQLAFYCLKGNDQMKFTYYYQNALEICSYSKYHLTEMALLKNLSKILKSLNLDMQSEYFDAQLTSLVGEKYEYFYDLVKH